MQKFPLPARSAAVVWATTMLVACGGGSDGSTKPADGAAVSSAQQCSATNPLRGDASGQTRVADLATEKQWIHAHLRENYLWDQELPVVDAGLPEYSQAQSDQHFNSLNKYFRRLTVERAASSTATKDRYSYIQSTKDYNLSIQSGISKATGAAWLTESKSPLVIRVRLVYPDTPASRAGLQRGDHLVSVNGYRVGDESEAAKAVINGLIDRTGQPGTYQVVVQRQGQELPAMALELGDVKLAPVTHTQVLPQPDGSVVGYLAFQSHNLAAEELLLAAAQRFQQAQVTDLVLDLRYNGGGRIAIANMLSSLMVSPEKTKGKTFNAERFNAQQAGRNKDYPFVTKTVVAKPALDLPHLNLSRVYVLTSARTCSASELIINGLEGIDVPVIRVGSTSCGKPHGMSPTDNCGITYSAISFKSVNHKGFGDYEQGIAPTCEVAEDLNQPLGDVNENLLHTALMHRAQGQCPAGAAARSAQAAGLHDVSSLLRDAERDEMNMYGEFVND